MGDNRRNRVVAPPLSPLRSRKTNHQTGNAKNLDFIAAISSRSRRGSDDVELKASTQIVMKPIIRRAMTSNTETRNRYSRKLIQKQRNRLTPIKHRRCATLTQNRHGQAPDCLGQSAYHQAMAYHKQSLTMQRKQRQKEERRRAEVYAINTLHRLYFEHLQTLACTAKNAV